MTIIQRVLWELRFSKKYELGEFMQWVCDEIKD